jgi:hypothetical protein
LPHRQPPPAHLSISYERLRELARRAGHTQTAEWLPIEAGDTRRVLYRQRPGCVDRAEELATTLSQLAGVNPPNDTDAHQDQRYRDFPER